MHRTLCKVYVRDDFFSDDGQKKREILYVAHCAKAFSLLIIPQSTCISIFYCTSINIVILIY